MAKHGEWNDVIEMLFLDLSLQKRIKQTGFCNKSMSDGDRMQQRPPGSLSAGEEQSDN